MKNTKLYEEMGLLDGDLITEAEKVETKPKSYIKPKQLFALSAAILVLTIGSFAGLMLFGNGGGLNGILSEGDEPQTEESAAEQETSEDLSEVSGESGEPQTEESVSGENEPREFNEVLQAFLQSEAGIICYFNDLTEDEIAEIKEKLKSAKENLNQYYTENPDEFMKPREASEALSESTMTMEELIEKKGDNSHVIGEKLASALYHDLVKLTEIEYDIYQCNTYSLELYKCALHDDCYITCQNFDGLKEHTHFKKQVASFIPHEWVNRDVENFWEAELELTLDEFPGVTFKWNSAELIAVKDGVEQALFGGMPIWNVILADLNKDGFPEFCSEISVGSGIIDNRIAVCDYANDCFYDLSDRGEYDYSLTLEDDYSFVMVNQTLSFMKIEEPDSDTWGTGTGELTIIDGELVVVGINSRAPVPPVSISERQ